ncbi:MAG: AEC family transporter [Firmicutes bacterium]|nr:AEC family transporter [Bacillota bacterium]
MMESFIFSVNAVLPVFLLVLLGFVLRIMGQIDDRFIKSANTLLFNVFFFCRLFDEIWHSDLRQDFDIPLILAGVLGTLFCFVLMRLVVPRFLPSVPVYTAFIQGAFRGNFLLLGLVIVENVSGASGVTKAAMMMPITVPLYNILSVLLLSENNKQTGWGKTFKKIATNPLILASICGVIASLVNLQIPNVLYSPIKSLGNIASPLAMLLLGANIKFDKGLAGFKLGFIGTSIKLIFQPLLMCIIFVLLGFRGPSLVVLMVMMGAPSAVSSFPMAASMGADADLASQLVVFSTALSSFTLFLFIFALKSMMLI